MTVVFVTGAAGFLGANAVRRLAHDGHDVHGTVRLESDRWRLEGADVQLHDVDLSDAAAVTRVVRDVAPRWVFHIAARGAYSWQRRDDEIVRANVVGTLNVLSAAADVGFDAFVCAGSSSEYGPKPRPATETDEPSPRTTYALTKAFSTQYCQLVARDRSLPVRVLRLYSVYGPYEDPRRLMPRLLVSASHGTLPPLVSPKASHDFVYVDDVFEAFVAAARATDIEPGAVFNIGSGAQTPLESLVSLVRATFGVDAAPRWGSMPDRPWDTDVWCADVDKAARELAWEPRTSLRDGLLRFATWLGSEPGIVSRYASASEFQRRQ